MGRRFSRRAFLIGSTAIAGGVVFGGYAVARDAANPLKQGLGLNAATFNPWVKISPEKITLITPHADVGQGVASAQAILIAEITSALVFINVSPYWTDALRGGLILTTVIADILRRQRRAARGWKK